MGRLIFMIYRFTHTQHTPTVMTVWKRKSKPFTIAIHARTTLLTRSRTILQNYTNKILQHLMQLFVQRV